MSELSRVKKNETLRIDVENDREEELVSPALSTYAERLNKINPVLSKVKVQKPNPNYSPLHKKRLDAFSEHKNIDNLESQFSDSYMNDFLDEVKAYNLEKGYRKTEDTSKDILKPIKKDKELSSINEIENKEEIIEDKSLDKELEEETCDNKDTAIQQESLDITLQEDQEAIRRMIASDFIDVDEENQAKDLSSSLNSNTSSTDIQLVVEETQKLKLQITEYEKGLIDMNNSVLSSNRLLNFLIFILVLVLMIMLGIAIYWVLYSKGFY